MGCFPTMNPRAGGRETPHGETPPGIVSSPNQAALPQTNYNTEVTIMTDKALPDDELDDLNRFEEEGGLEVPTPDPMAASPADSPKHYRRLQPDELVSAGDYVSDRHQGFALWAGPIGFQAGLFIKTIYRPTKAPSPRDKKSQ